MPMTKEHKDALAKGRKEARAVKKYLAAIDKKGSGRTPSKKTLQSRLEKINQQIDEVDDPLRKVELVQSKLDIEKALGSSGDEDDFDQVESDFVAHAKSYSERKGITYTAWREFGVPAKTLREAGIPETRRR